MRAELEASTNEPEFREKYGNPEGSVHFEMKKIDDHVGFHVDENDVSADEYVATILRRRR